MWYWLLWQLISYTWFYVQNGWKLAKITDTCMRVINVHWVQLLPVHRDLGKYIQFWSKHWNLKEKWCHHYFSDVQIRWDLDVETERMFITRTGGRHLNMNMLSLPLFSNIHMLLLPLFPIIKIRQSCDHLIFIVGILYMKDSFYIEMGPDLWALKPRWISIKIQYSLQWKGRHTADDLLNWEARMSTPMTLTLFSNIKWRTDYKITNWSGLETMYPKLSASDITGHCHIMLSLWQLSFQFWNLPDHHIMSTIVYKVCTTLHHDELLEVSASIVNTAKPLI